MDKIKQFKPDHCQRKPVPFQSFRRSSDLKAKTRSRSCRYHFRDVIQSKAGEYPDDFARQKVVVVGGAPLVWMLWVFRTAAAQVYHRWMLPQIGMLADPITKCSMRETHDKYGVKEYVNTALQEVKENAFTVELPDADLNLNFDLGFQLSGNA